MKKKQGRKMAALVIVAMVVVCGIIAGPALLAGDKDNAALAETAEARAFPVRAESAERQTLRAFLKVNGDIVSAQETDVFPDAPGKLIRVYVSLGSAV
ncbi:MAG: hypothetical protein LBH73_07510, partial [Spirochaetaceae bacterium]|nr:hypothetical protein [Spirochaetaceae bacterium]